MDYNTLSLNLHRKLNGKIKIISKTKLEDASMLSLLYTPGVAQPCLEIQKNPLEWYELTSASQTVAVISDGSAVLGLGNIGAKAALPVMEGKAVLFREFGDVNAFPIVLETQDTEEIIKSIKLISSSFGGINLEDISAPRCFEIEDRLKKELDIPVFHDDQHGTAIVTLAGLINSLKITGKSIETSKVVINGSGSAGIAIANLLHKYGFKNLYVCDSKGLITRKRSDLTDVKLKLLTISNKDDLDGDIKFAIKNCDIFIGVSKGNLLNEDDIKSMNKDPIIIAMANPVPEIMPDIAKKGGAKIVATGRSDFPNQLNNVLVFPGIFKGALSVKAKDITDSMKLAAAKSLAELVENPTEDKIIPSPFEKNVSEVVAKAVINEYKQSK